MFAKIDPGPRGEDHESEGTPTKHGTGHAAPVPLNWTWSTNPIDGSELSPPFQQTTLRYSHPVSAGSGAERAWGPAGSTSVARLAASWQVPRASWLSAYASCVTSAPVELTTAIAMPSLKIDWKPSALKYSQSRLTVVEPAGIGMRTSETTEFAGQGNGPPFGTNTGPFALRRA